MMVFFAAAFVTDAHEDLLERNVLVRQVAFIDEHAHEERSPALGHAPLDLERIEAAAGRRV